MMPALRLMMRRAGSARMPSQALATADSSELSPSGPYRGLKQFGLVLLCGAWILLGLVGHDPWKTEDATSFGVAWSILQNGSWLTPTLAGEPYTDHPPLVYAVAAIFGRAFGSILPAHDAARLAVGFFLALTMIVLSLAASELYNRTFRWLPVLLFVGSVGLWDRAHQLSPELGVLLGVAFGLYGFALGLRAPFAGGAMLGLGVGVAFLSRGFMGPLWLTLTALVLPLAFAPWRDRRYALTIVIALGVALPLCASWPLALAKIAPAHLQEWWNARSVGEYFSPLAETTSDDPFYLIKNLSWYAWPALPLVLWTFWARSRGFNGGLSIPGIQLPATLAVVILVCLLLMTDPKAIYAMPLLLPLCLLGAVEVDSLKRGYSGAFDWFGILTFGLLAAVVWGLWLDAFANGVSPRIARLFRDTEPGYRPSFQWLAFALSAFLTVTWLMLVRPARRSNRRAVLNWAAGITLVWGLYMTIWLPYLDSRRSYRPVAESVATKVNSESCIGGLNLGEPQRALLHYFADLVTVRLDSAELQDCDAVLIQLSKNDDAPPAPRGWKREWEGHRRGDDTERFVLFRKIAP